MAVKKNGLGKGLDSLITDKISTLPKETTKEEKSNDTFIKISKVEPNKKQPRKKFDEDALLELTESIKQYGVLQPLLVQEKDGFYEIIAGERRWRAAKLAGLKEVPVVIKNLSEQEIVEISLIENIQREDLNPIEEAIAYKRLLSEFNLKQDDIAERVSKNRTTITNSIRLLKLDERVQQMLIDDLISSGHARALLTVENSEKQYKLAQRVFDEKLSVRETEKLVKNELLENKNKSRKEVDEQLTIIYKDIENKMKTIFGTKVSIHAKNQKSGKIEIEYYSPDELDRIYDLFQTINK